MNKKIIQDDLTEILIAAITEPVSPVKSVLEKAKKKTNAQYVRFRLRDWQDQSVVYVPHWIIGEGREEAEPDLARRFYYEPDEPSRMDCVVGLVARIARIKEEEAKKKKDNELIRKLKEGITEDEISRQEICFNNVTQEKVYNNFIDRLRSETNIWLEKATKWEKYLCNLKDKEKSSESFFSEAFSQRAPWNNEDNAEEKEGQWIQLQKYIEEERNVIEKFLEAVGKTARLYKLLYEKWKDYTTHAEIPRCEIAVPVVAFGKFLGVLNFHKEDKFTENDKHLARIHAAQLAVACLQRQTEVFKEFQKVARLIAAESNFEVIASKIAEGIRIELRDGLKNNEVFPLLYVANQPINRFDNLDDDEFKRRWEKTYRQRQKLQLEEMHDDLILWNKENQLGPIPIRPNGLGRTIIEKWKMIEKGSITLDGHLFIDSLDVDDPNSRTGSRSALNHDIKTTGCLPLIFEHRVYGLLYLHCTERHYFTDAELHALETSSIQAAIAINNARLTGSSYEELYGSKIFDLNQRLQKMNCFLKVNQKLNEWAVRVRSARGEIIADITTDTIKDLCGKEYFALPSIFKSYIDDYKRREGSLQSIADYRDHFVHPFHVFWLGYYILTQWSKKKIMPLDLTGVGDENFNLKTWFITSIYHDVGYPAEKLELLVRDFFKTSVGRGMNSQFDWSSVLLANDNIKHIDEFSNLFAKKTKGKGKAKIFERWFHKRLLEDHDHGVLTALMLCSQGWKEKDLETFIYEVALAIALHSWKRSPSKQLEFALEPLAIEDFPLAFFLSYCDTAQEWGRRVLLELMKKESVPFNTMRLESKLEEINTNLSETKVIIKYLTRKKDPVADGKTLKKVFDDVGAEFEPTWYLNEPLTNKFIIEGKDKDGFGIGGFGPRHR